MKFVSLFAGIGGFDLGLERAGHNCVGQVEIDDYATKVLEKHWPNVPRIRDVRSFQGTEFGSFDLLVGGYPCQPFSKAGKMKGIHDERHLWPEVERIIRAVRPQYVLMENVPTHLKLGFDAVLGSLAESGYDARWDCVPASLVGANHRRNRLFILANLVNAESRARAKEELESHAQGKLIQSRKSSSATLPKSDWWKTEPGVDIVAYGVPKRLDRLKALGNAVVPQVAELIARTWLPATLSE